MIHPTPRLRFAPSPTGPLHLGGARTAMYNWAAARAMGGAFVLRIEDTDRARSTDESLQIILQGLRWLGIDWDEGPEVDGDFGPYFQMQRQELYQQAADRLLTEGKAYPCYCTAEEIEAGRAAMKAAKTGFYGYNGRCRDLTSEQRQAFEAEGREPNLRFRMPESRIIKVHDMIRGEVEVDSAQLDDWVMVRRGGAPLYNFACVVDDQAMKITHVVRGDEHFLNGVKQQVLFEALGHECPQFAHIPLILNKSGKKLSKRDADTNMLDYRDKGFPAEAVFNYIALLGWGFSADRDLFTRAEMVERFRIESVGKAGAKFDEEKLLWMAGEYVRGMSSAECLSRARPWLQDAVPAAVWETHADWLANGVNCFQQRVQLLSEFGDKLAWLFAEPLEFDAAAQKNLRKSPDAQAWLRAYAQELATANLPPSWPADRQGVDRAVCLPSQADAEPPASEFAIPTQLEQGCRAFAERLEVKFGHLVHPVRAALTGTNKGPGLFDVVWLLGGERCIQRLEAAADWLDG